MFAGGWTGPGHYVCSIAPGDGPDADIVLVDADTGEQRTLARGGFLSVTAVSADERFLLARRGPRGYRHIVVIDVATGVSAGCCRWTPRAGIASEDGRFGTDGRSVHLRASLPGEPGTDRAGLVAVPLSEDGVPGEGRVVLYRAGRRPGRLRPARRRHRAGGVDAPRGHRAVGARPVRRVAAAADRRCPSRSCRAGRWPPTARRWSPS